MTSCITVKEKLVPNSANEKRVKEKLTALAFYININLPN
tara:strand:+ start:350 stop:466 length:117 start_codon:yes stop_codon:yes gene_type:complete